VDNPRSSEVTPMCLIRSGSLAREWGRLAIRSCLVVRRRDLLRHYISWIRARARPAGTTLPHVGCVTSLDPALRIPPGRSGPRDQATHSGDPPVVPAGGSTWHLSSCDGPIPRQDQSPTATVSPMTDWPEGWIPQTAEEAQEYLDFHRVGGGNSETIDMCAAMLDQRDHPNWNRPADDGGQAVPVPIPKPSEDQLEEFGAD